MPVQIVRAWGEKALIRLSLRDSERWQTTEDIIEAYCDGSISPSSLEEAHTSHKSGHVGRVMVVIPALDRALVVQFYDNLTLPNGHENSLFGEIKAIEQADSFCKEKTLGHFRIYSDNPSAIESIGLSSVQRIPKSRLNIANEYLRSLLSYAQYSRGSEDRKRTRLNSSHRL